MIQSVAALDLPPGRDGVLPSQMLRQAIDIGVVDGADPALVQPASIDLRLGEVAYRLRHSFLPGADPVDLKLKQLTLGELDLRAEGAVLDRYRPYLIPLVERLELPAHVRAKANPKSSTGRLDVFTRVITDYSHRFDEIRSGYRGPLFVEVVPLSFAVQVQQGLSLNQLRLVVGHPAMTNAELVQEHEQSPLLFRGGAPVVGGELAEGLALSLELPEDRRRHVGYRARENAPAVAMARRRAHNVLDYWDPVEIEAGHLVLEKARFYLLLSEESVSVPPHLAAEMTAYDPTSGELRTHYAGFFDPGFGYVPGGELRGSQAALEVRAHDVSFMIDRGQPVARLTFDRMLAEPDRLYGRELDSNYQGQVSTLSKHFRRSPADRPATD